MDEKGNIYIEDPNEYTHDNEKKDFQWLGASMDGGPLETDRFVVSQKVLHLFILTSLISINYYRFVHQD